MIIPISNKIVSVLLSFPISFYSAGEIHLETGDRWLVGARRCWRGKGHWRGQVTRGIMLDRNDHGGQTIVIDKSK